MKTLTPSQEKTLDHVRKHGPLMLGVLSGDGQYDSSAEALIELGILVEVREPRKFIFDDLVQIDDRYLVQPTTGMIIESNVFDSECAQGSPGGIGAGSNVPTGTGAIGLIQRISTR